MKPAHRACLLTAVLIGLGAPPARADIFAAVNVRAPSPRSDVDVAVLNASTGARVSLPAGTNTAADELHPGITPDGSRLTFERFDRAAGTVRIIVVDLGTSRSADLFNAFEVAARTPKDPAITPDGKTVYTGGTYDEPSPGSFSNLITPTGLGSFPNPPFPHGEIRTGFTHSGPPGMASDLSAGSSGLLAYKEDREGVRDLILTQLVGGETRFRSALSGFAATHSNPALASNSTQNVLFDRRLRNPDGTFGRGDIAFNPATASGFFAIPKLLPAIVNTVLDESQPAQSSDGRYVAFVRHGADGHDRLFLWDSQTQTLLNAGGVDLGAITTRDVGAVTLYSRFVLATSQLSLSGTVSFQLLQSSGVGLIVQRISGVRRVLGRKAYLLGPARRVPLGTFKAGRRHARWDFNVGGKRLSPGRYLVTIRAVTASRVVRELGRSRVIRSAAR